MSDDEREPWSHSGKQKVIEILVAILLVVGIVAGLMVLSWAISPR
jgi:flagellar basal body-associated protein FliL